MSNHSISGARTSKDWDQLARCMLPKPVTHQDGLIIGGEPGEVVVRISANEIAVAAYAAVWDSQEPRLAPKAWKSFPMTAKPERVARAIIKARARRLGTYQWCPECGTVQPPVWMSDGMCQGCAEKGGSVL